MVKKAVIVFVLSILLLAGCSKQGYLDDSEVKKQEAIENTETAIKIDEEENTVVFELNDALLESGKGLINNPIDATNQDKLIKLQPLTYNVIGEDIYYYAWDIYYDDASMHIDPTIFKLDPATDKAKKVFSETDLNTLMQENEIEFFSFIAMIVEEEKMYAIIDMIKPGEIDGLYFCAIVDVDEMKIDFLGYSLSPVGYSDSELFFNKWDNDGSLCLYILNLRDRSDRTIPYLLNDDEWLDGDVAQYEDNLLYSTLNETGVGRLVIVNSESNELVKSIDLSHIGQGQSELLDWNGEQMLFYNAAESELTTYNYKTEKTQTLVTFGKQTDFVANNLEENNIVFKQRNGYKHNVADGYYNQHWNIEECIIYENKETAEDIYFNLSLKDGSIEILNRIPLNEILKTENLDCISRFKDYVVGDYIFTFMDSYGVGVEINYSSYVARFKLREDINFQNWHNRWDTDHPNLRE